MNCNIYVFLLEYKDDDDYVPKNSSLVVKRVPVTNASKSLVSKLKGLQNPQAEIIMPTKPEQIPETLTSVSIEEEPLTSLEEDEYEPASSELMTENELSKLIDIQTEKYIYKIYCKL
jgi:hypothetical protein